MMSLIDVMKVFREVYPSIREIDNDVGFGAFLGLLCDQWSADNDVTMKDMEELIERLLGIMKDVHSTEGEMPKTTDSILC